MRKTKFFLLLIILIDAFWTQGQNLNAPTQYDTLPTIYHFRQQVGLLNRIRCATYLFARNFTLKDSLGNIYLSLFYDRDSHETTPEQINATSLTIFDVTYTYAFESDIEYLKRSYQSFIVSAYDKNGKLIHYKDYRIQRYQHHNTKDYLSHLLERIRVPNTWTLKKHEYEIIYYCMDKDEQMVFCRPLILVLLNMKLLDENCTSWREFYPACHDLENAPSAIVKIPK